jgi:hypothetical protein
MISLNVDLTAILDLQRELEPKVQKAFLEAAQGLALQSHAHILEEAQSKLHSTRDKYVSALNFKQVSKDVWVISLDASAMWIEEGKPEGSMLDDLLASPKAKTAKDGSKFIVVPFQHNKGPSRQTQAQNDLTATIKQELRNRKIPYGKLETDETGQPKLGKLHTFDIWAPVKTAEGPGQGKGPIGPVKQGPTGIPFLNRVNVYQREIKNAAGKSSVRKDIMTFRVASSKHRAENRWFHPGTPARNLFESTADWAIKEWETKIVPDLLRRLDVSL